MRYVILRDDDTNAFTPPECLEKLYRPFLDRELPVNLAVIPEVHTDARRADGHRECFLPEKNGQEDSVPIGDNAALVSYLHANPGYHVVQHGCHHDPFEFDRKDRAEVVRRLERGAHMLRAAGFYPGLAFVAPHDRFSRISLEEASRRFAVVSTGWFELGRLPFAWLPYYIVKKIRRQPHWRVGRTLLLSHPGCLLSCVQPFGTMLETVKRTIEKQKVTVLVTHWWEYFWNSEPKETFIGILHQTAEYLAGRPDVRVISFADLSQHAPQ
ncbi:MAG: DUF2334 domain-containing protein [Verrucomicrobiota bacterium]|nr:DUF2334 domain-containing protein [Verrucomicrobiota bacterium]